MLKPTLFFAAALLVGLTTLCGVAAVTAGLNSTPPATWDISGTAAEDPLGGYAGVSGTITVHNDGPGPVTVAAYDAEGHGRGIRTIKAGETKNLQVRAGQTVEIKMTSDHQGSGADDHAEGSATFTPYGATGSGSTAG